MGIVPFGHPGIGVPELRRDDRARDALGREPAGVGAAQDVELDGPGNLAPRTRRDEPDMSEQSRTAAMTVIDWARLLRCSAAGRGMLISS
jgi:hypothetical protein